MAKKKQTAPDRLVSADRKAPFAAVIATALVAGLWFTYTSPAGDKADEARSARDAKAAQLADVEQRTQRLKSGAERRAEQLLVSSRRLDAQLPASVDRLDLVTRIEQLSRARGVTASNMTPGEQVTSGTVTGQVFNASFSGPIGGLAALFGELQQMNPVVTIEGVSISVSDGDGSVAVRLTAWSSTSPTLAQLPRVQVTPTPSTQTPPTGTPGTEDPDSSGNQGTPGTQMPNLPGIPNLPDVDKLPQRADDPVADAAQ